MSRFRLTCGACAALLMACGQPPAAPDAGATADGGTGADGNADPLFPSTAGSVTVFEAIATDGSQAGEAAASFGGLDTTEVFYVEQLRHGDCRLLAHEVGFCEPYCDMDEVCTHDDVCQSVHTAGQSAGVITVETEAGTITMTPSGGWYAVDPTPLPEDLFEPGDTVLASAPGDQITGFTLLAAGVPAVGLSLTGPAADELRMVDGSDFAIEWTSAYEGSRIRLRLSSPASWHGLPPGRIIECDAADTGSLVIPRELVEAFPIQAREESCHGYVCDESMFPRSTLLRYHRAVTTSADGPIELLVGSLRRFYLLHPAP